MILACLAVIGFCYFIHRLAIQSSYYADPRRRFCGTLERFFAQITRLTNSLVSAKPLSYFNFAPSLIDTKELAFFNNVRQFWFWDVPESNLKALPRFQERQEEMARREKMSRDSHEC